MLSLDTRPVIQTLNFYNFYGENGLILELKKKKKGKKTIKEARINTTGVGNWSEEKLLKQSRSKTRNQLFVFPCIVQFVIT